MTTQAAKHILVTGADGFIGSHLTEMLVKQGHKVKALSQYNSFNYWGWLEDICCLNDIEVLSGDVRDPHFCNKIAKGVDTVFHLAALIAIPYSYEAPDSYVDTNIIKLSSEDYTYGEDGWRIDYSTDGSTWTELASIAADSTFYLHTNLAAGSTFYYRMRSYRGASETSSIRAASA